VLELARSGRVLWPLAPADAWSSFLTLAAARGTPCFERSGELIAVSDGVAVLTAMTALRRRIDDGCLTMDPIDVLERLSTGSSAVYCPLIFGYSNYARRNFRPARLGFADIPSFGGAAASGALLGGVGIAVSRRCPQARDAASYAVWAAGGEVQRTLWFGAGGQPGNAAAWDDPALDREAGGFFSATRPTLEASWMRPRFPGFPALQEAGMRLVHEFLAGGGDPEQTIAELNGACRASSPAAGLR
jgi:multiple sugar transport system substrate-binding protein